MSLLAFRRKTLEGRMHLIFFHVLMKNVFQSSQSPGSEFDSPPTFRKLKLQLAIAFIISTKIFSTRGLLSYNTEVAEYYYPDCFCCFRVDGKFTIAMSMATLRLPFWKKLETVKTRLSFMCIMNRYKRIVLKDSVAQTEYMN